MIKKLYEEAKSGINRRQNLSALKNEVKDFVKMDRLYELIADEMDVMISFLQDEDAKTRKNAALLMGAMDMSDFCEPLIQAYLKENTLFVRASYLEAVKEYDYEPFLPLLKKEQARILENPILPENKKHVEEELKLLNQLISKVEGYATHTFTGFQEPQDVILLTNKLQKEAVLSEIQSLPISATYTEFSGGIRLRTKDVKTLFLCRSFHSMLFLLKGVGAISFDPIEIAEAVAASNLLPMLRASHKEGAPFLFRIELKSHLDLEKKSAFTKKLSNELQMLTKHELVNDTSHYEYELRVIENKSGKCNVLLKMNTIQDKRFLYQCQPYATSLKPANAALLVTLGKKYMVKDAQVLDPYVSGGELLIERQMVVKANTSYGLDTREDAILSAKRHAFESDQIIHFVKKDFGSFTHTHLFDEIFTQMPFETIHRDSQSVKEEYEVFFSHVDQVMKKEGTLILYVHDLPYLLAAYKNTEWKLIEKIPIGNKEQTYLCILKRESAKNDN